MRNILSKSSWNNLINTFSCKSKISSATRATQYLQHPRNQIIKNKCLLNQNKFNLCVQNNQENKINLTLVDEGHLIEKIHVKETKEDTSLNNPEKGNLLDTEKRKKTLNKSILRVKSEMKVEQKNKLFDIDKENNGNNHLRKSQNDTSLIKIEAADTKNEVISNKYKNVRKSLKALKNTSSDATDLAQKDDFPQLPSDNLFSFAYKNNTSYAIAIKNKSFTYFASPKNQISLVYFLDDRNINIYKEGILDNNYDFYEKYPNVPEIIFLGRSNVGKSSLINALFQKEHAKSNKKQGKTQRLEFFLLKKNQKENKLFIIDAPGFGYVDGPVVLKKKFKYLIYTYLNYAVRLKVLVYLINGEYGISESDKREIAFLNNFNKEIQLVFTKVDKMNSKEIIKYITEASLFAQDLVNVRQEILLTSSRNHFGIDNLRSHLYMDIEDYKMEK